MAGLAEWVDYAYLLMVNQDLMWDEIKLRDADLLKRLAEERARL